MLTSCVTEATEINNRQLLYMASTGIYIGIKSHIAFPLIILSVLEAVSDDSRCQDKRDQNANICTCLK